MIAPRLGCIADDFTGATDVANSLARAGMRTMLTVGVTGFGEGLEADAIVVALKSRTLPPDEAVQQSVKACRALRALGTRQIYQKICSTFDSTSEGNIGPVLEALMDELGCAFSVVAPAFPENGRTVYRGYLFVHDMLLSESSMSRHPLTPMTDSNLLRVLAAQLRSQPRRQIRLLSEAIVSTGEDSLRGEMIELEAHGCSIAIADAISDSDLARLAATLRESVLVTASAGLAGYLPAQWGFMPSEDTVRLPKARGCAGILAGSCSEATNRQVRHFLQNGTGFRLDPMELAADAHSFVERVLRWSERQWQLNPKQPLLVYSTAESADVSTVQKSLGMQNAGVLIEGALGEIAVGWMQRGVRQLIVAGGESSGACVQALEVARLRIGPQIDPGVPWCYADAAKHAPDGLHLALKSGNFGSDDLFWKALTQLAEATRNGG
jgi:3-dehydrotetronate 4-kinase